MDTDRLVTAKVVRAAFFDIQRARSRLTHIAARLHRLYYKSKAQHRRARWFQTLDGMRKCFRRTLQQPGDLTTGLRTRHILDVQVDASLPNRAGRSERRQWARSTARGGTLARFPANGGALHAASLSLVEVWCSLWGETRQGRTNLPKYDCAPTFGCPSTVSLERCVEHLFVLCIQMEELSHRARLTFNTLYTQLRTPPAPVFAPLIVILLPLTASVHHTSRRFLWSSRASSTPSTATTSKPVGHQMTADDLSHPFALLYTRMQQQVSQLKERTANTPVKRKPGSRTGVGFLLDASLRPNIAAWHHALNLVQDIVQSDHATFAARLPPSLVQPVICSPGRHDTVEEEKSTASSASMPTLSAYAPPFERSMQDDEDLGEAV